MAESDLDFGPVEAAVRAELIRMGAVAAEGARAAMAVDLARRQDGAHTPTAAAQVAKELREVLKELRADFPPQQAKDGVDQIKDELKAKRQRRGAS